MAWTQQELERAFFDYDACEFKRCAADAEVCECRDRTQHAAHIAFNVLNRTLTDDSSLRTDTPETKR